jgi:hypothetical protein
MPTDKLHYIKFDNKANPNTWLLYVFLSTLICQSNFFYKNIGGVSTKPFSKK